MTQFSPEPYTAPVAPTDAPRGNGLGLASLIIGIIALVGSLIPVLNYATGFVAFVGLVLGIVALFLTGRRKGTAIAGGIINVVALLLSIVLAFVYTAGIATFVAERLEDDLVQRFVTLRYEVTGDSTENTIIFATYDEGTFGSEQVADQVLPFTDEQQVNVSGDSELGSYYITATNGEVGGAIGCRVVVDGTVMSEETGSGPFASVTCSAAGSDLDFG